MADGYAVAVYCVVNCPQYRIGTAAGADPSAQKNDIFWHLALFADLKVFIACSTDIS